MTIQLIRFLPPLVVCAMVATAAPHAPLAARDQVPGFARSSQTALDRYVAAPDASFAWKVLRELPAEGARATLLEMTSQRWLTEQEVERPLWTHWITVVSPARLTSDVALLFITGGSLDRQPPARPTRRKS
jgi:PhoPQ-activated pathogenicity-related protein